LRVRKDPDQEGNLELIPAHHRQDAMQEALDEKAGNLSALVPRGARAILLRAKLIPGGSQ